MNCSRVIFSQHALKAMISRNIDVEEAEEIIKDGETIADYPTDKPYPGKLLLKFVKDRPVHLVIAQNLDTKECIIITCYIPDPLLWDEDFKQKIK